MLRGACVASTALLVWTLIDYHRIEVKIALIDSGADDWRVAYVFFYIKILNYHNVINYVITISIKRFFHF